MQRGVFICVAIGFLLTIGFDRSGPINPFPKPIDGAVAANSATIDEANGQIIQIEGDVSLQRENGQTLAPTTGTLLYPGDRLHSAGGLAFVQCSDLSIDAVGGRFSRRNPCASVESFLARRNRDQCDADSYRCPNRGDENNTDEPTIPYVISPRRTNLLNPRPQFRWNTVENAQSYEVCLLEDEVLQQWCREIDRAQMNYPAEESPLKPGKRYLLTVGTDRGTYAPSLKESGLFGGVGFKLLDTQQAEQIEEIRSRIESQDIDATAKALAIVLLYTDNGLISAAIDILEALVARGVDTAPIYDRLAWLYSDYLALESPDFPHALENALESEIELSDVESDRITEID